MASNAEKALAIFNQSVGTEEEVGDWFTVDQERINAFADATLDHQFIHVDPEMSAKLSPYKVPIAHGFLTLSMLTHLCGSIKNSNPEAYEGVIAGVNYGFDKVRFPNPVKVNSKIRARRKLAEAVLKGNAIQLKYAVSVEIDGEEKPGCAAEWLNRVVYS